MSAGPPWPDAAVALLRDLYAERKPNGKPMWSMDALAIKLSAMPEADRVYSCNAVVGRCHRLGLEKRKAAFPTRDYVIGAVRASPGQAEPNKRHRYPAKPRPPRATPTAARVVAPVVLAVPTAASDVPPWEDIPPPPPPQEPPPTPQPDETPKPDTTAWESAAFMLQSPTAHMSYPRPDATNVVSLRSTTCQFPFGTPRTKEFRFCGEPTWSCDDPSESAIYCQFCYRKCHVANPLRDRIRMDRQLRRA